jgi:L-alanine-DL-glutamate epimerase-like enolase superfamily enzyme
VRASLHAADLHYGGGLVLHTASSGSVPHLAELYLRLEEDGIVGIGEVRANIAYLNGLSPQAVTADALAAGAAIDWSLPPEQLLAGIDAWATPSSAPVRALIDAALHDLVARQAGRTVSAWLTGAEPAPVSAPTNQTLFWSSDEDFAARAARYVERGFRYLKVRVAAGEFARDISRIAHLRESFGDSVKIAADANGQWSEDEAARHLEALAGFGLAYVEQPIAAGDWAALGRLAASSPVPIMLDESVTGSADIERICDAGGRLWAHLKLVKLGGIGPTFRAARQLAAAGVPFMVGQMNEGAAATAAALHVVHASAPAFAELYGADGLTDDPASGLSYGDGAVSLASTAGLGVTFDASRAHLIREF